VLRELILFRRLLLISVEQEDESATWLQEFCSHVEQVVVQLDEVKVLFLTVVRLIGVQSFSLWSMLLRVWDACLLGTSSDPIGWVAHNTVEDRSKRNALLGLKHVELQRADVHGEEIRDWHAVMLEVGKNVVLVDFVEAFNSLISCFGPDAIALEYSYVEIAADHTCVEVLASDCDAASADEGVVDQVTGLDLGLVSHEEGDLMVSRCRSKVRSLLEMVLVMECVVILALPTVLINSIANDLPSTVDSPGWCILDYLVNKLSVLEAHVFIVKRKLFEQFNDLNLLLETDFPADGLDAELELLAQR